MVTHHFYVPVSVLVCIAFRLAPHLEDRLVSPLAARKRRESCYQKALMFFFFLLLGVLTYELVFASLLTLQPHGDGFDDSWLFVLFMLYATLGSGAIPMYIACVCNQSQLYFSSWFQSCTIWQCVLCGFLGAVSGVLAVGFFWTDWVLAAQVDLYKGYALSAGPNSTVGEEHISSHWMWYGVACSMPMLTM
jgi:hypothetical protein